MSDKTIPLDGSGLKPLKLIDNGDDTYSYSIASLNVGTKTDAAVIDPTLTASEIALLKGLLAQMRGEGTAGKSMPVQVAGSLTEQIIFQNAVSEIGDGTSLTVGGFRDLTVGITSSGENTARTIEFHGVDAAGNDNLIIGVNLNNLNTGASTTGTGEIWTFSITGLVTVYIKLTSITGGTVTAIGKVVA